ncbi:MAG: CRISPR-associated endonuclease Cas2 [Methanotrichaceae archaeon]
MSGLQSYVVSYDIIMDQKRLQRVHKTMMGFGRPVHYSMFRCDLDQKGREEMISALNKVINHREDRIMVIDLGPMDGRADERIEFLGKKPKKEEHKALIF